MLNLHIPDEPELAIPAERLAYEQASLIEIHCIDSLDGLLVPAPSYFWVAWWFGFLSCAVFAVLIWALKVECWL